MRKCPDGVFCVEHCSVFFVILCLSVFAYFFFLSNLKHHSETSAKQNIIVNNRETTPVWNVPNMLNPFAPPLRDERYLVPINVSTNIGAVDTQYRQVGILNSLNTKSAILALMGRPIFTNRDKWQYYTNSNDGNVGIKLPVSRSGRSCTNEYGCDKLYNGDTVYIEGINEAYRVTLYDNDTMRYLPFV